MTDGELAANGDGLQLSRVLGFPERGPLSCDGNRATQLFAASHDSASAYGNHQKS
jgi:hypothetical protein